MAGDSLQSTKPEILQRVFVFDFPDPLPLPN
jgi:hypothetical protein